MGSSIPAVLDYLVAALTAVVDAETLVIDGRLVRPDGGVEDDYIAFGFNSTDPEGPAVVSDETIYFGPGLEENYEIFCEAGSWDGDAITKKSRDRAFALLDMVIAVLVADPRMGDLVMGARPLSKGVIQPQTSSGSSVKIPFSIQIRAIQNT
jgi:hypothetical protein